MEVFFIIVLIVLLMSALASGYPVAFALPGAALLTILLAAAAGLLFAGDTSAYFAQGDPVQWLNAAVTNFRGIYYEVERDTLIAIPLFVFMGIMLQRSKVAEDLLVAMAQLFGPIPGGLGISVIFVGALLAATTGIVGATVIAMGLISLPVMLRNNYSAPLATGTIASSGTLGQIIPPSIVLIILADQLSNAIDRAATLRKDDYKLATGEFSMPTEFDLSSTSAGEMFLGAMVPGLLLVGIYMLYILCLAILKPKVAPPVPYKGKYDRTFFKTVLLSLVPPLTLIFVVLGSIILGVATVNQAGAIGAIGAMIMAGYRLKEGKGQFYPAILAVLSLLVITLLVNTVDLNLRSSEGAGTGLVSLAVLAVFGLVTAVGWSAWRVYHIEDTLRWVMLETAKTTTMVFIILLGAAMLTAAFRAFGGEELVREYLSALPGGFITKFVVVMAVIFLLGFFLDFIEIAVVVVPIIAPILLADTSANITGVWLGVMIGINMQTSFLTPPFGFALFYLRGVAPPQVRTTQIYRGVIPFIVLQLLALAIVGVFPNLVNYLPNRVALTSETSPPPRNPRLQACLQDYLFPLYDTQGERLGSAIDVASRLDLSALPDSLGKELSKSFDLAHATFAKVAAVRQAEAALADYAPGYRPIHEQTRRLELDIRKHRDEIAGLEQDIRRLSASGDTAQVATIEAIRGEIATLNEDIATLSGQIPETWKPARKEYLALSNNVKAAKRSYYQTVDGAYEPVAKVVGLIHSVDRLADLEAPLRELRAAQGEKSAEQLTSQMKETESLIGTVPETSKIRSLVSKARRELRKEDGTPAQVQAFLEQALALLDQELTWRRAARDALAAGLTTYDQVIGRTIGLRLQERLSDAEAEEVASCLSHHQDISLAF